jgi:signal transduction histidine kinase
MNRRILVIDDQEAIHEDFRLILGPGHGDADEIALDDALSRLGIPSAARASAEFDLAFASQGRDGFELAKKARADGNPIAVAFVDVRMPPGWDGVETLAHIAEIDREIQFVAMTAYSDRDRRQMVDAVGEPSRLLFVKKPFAAEEIEQAAIALSDRWNLHRAEKERTRVMEGALDLLRAAAAADDRGLEAIATSVLNSLVELAGARSGAILSKSGVWVRTPDYDPNQMPDAAPAASVTDFAAVQNGYAVRLTERDVLVIEQPNRLARMPDLLHLVVSAFAQVLRAARQSESRIAAERDAAMGRALGDVAHDLKGHIFSLLGFAEVLQDSPPAERELYSARICDIAQDMKTYVDDLLDFAHTRRGIHASRVELMALARSVAADFGPSLVRVNGPDELPALVDGVKLIRALRNIVANAVDKAANEAADFGVEVTVREAGGGVEIFVQDNGREVAAAVRADMFQPLVSHGKPGGTGLGLAIAQDFVTRHGGELTLEESRPGCTRFKIWLPGVVETAAA